MSWNWNEFPSLFCNISSSEEATVAVEAAHACWNGGAVSQRGGGIGQSRLRFSSLQEMWLGKRRRERRCGVSGRAERDGEFSATTGGGDGRLAAFVGREVAVVGGFCGFLRRFWCLDGVLAVFSRFRRLENQDFTCKTADEISIPIFLKCNFHLDHIFLESVCFFRKESVTLSSDNSQNKSNEIKTQIMVQKNKTCGVELQHGTLNNNEV